MIFESRIAARGKGPEVNREDIEIATQIEVFVKPKKKDESPSRSKSPTRESNKEKIEMHILDRGLRAAAGGS